MKIVSSEECSKSELDLFSVPPTQIAIEEGVWDTISPHPNFRDNDTIRFDIPGTNAHYIDLSQTELHLKITLQKTSGADRNLTETDKCGVVNNLLHSLFEQVQVNLNNIPVENTNKTYAYRAYLENLLCYSKESKETFLRGDYWIKDDDEFKKNFEIQYVAPVSEIPAYNLGTSKVRTAVKEVKVNKGFVERRKPFLNGNIVPLCGRLHCDIFNINRYLLSNVDLKLTLSRSRPEFYLKGDDARNFKIYIEEAYVKIRRVTISPSVMLAHATALEKMNAKYPFKRVLVRPFVIPYQSSKFTIVGIHQGIMPTRVVLGFVKTSDFDGSFTASYPYYFDNMQITDLNLKIASKSLPYSTSLRFDFEKDNYIEGYNSLFKNIREAPNDISYKDYANGYTIFAFDLTPDLCSDDHYSLLKDGSLDLEVTCKQFKDSYTAIFYLEFDNLIEITKERQIVYDYKV